MSKKIVKESFPGQPEDKDLSTGVSVPFKQANKEHDENIKAAEEAMEANEEAVDLVYGDNTKKKDGNFKNNELKKMHLSEDLFKSNFDEDYGYNEEDRIAEIVDQLQYVLDDVMEDALGEDEIDKDKRISKSALLNKISDFCDEPSNRYYFTESYKNDKLTESSQREWADYKERCSDCIALVEEDNRWFCDEAEDFCENVKCCPEGLGCLKEELDLDEAADSIFDKIAKKVAPNIGEDLKKNK